MSWLIYPTSGSTVKGLQHLTLYRHNFTELIAINLQQLLKLFLFVISLKIYLLCIYEYISYCESKSTSKSYQSQWVDSGQQELTESWHYMAYTGMIEQIWDTSRENLSSGVCDQVRLQPACSATETS